MASTTSTRKPFTSTTWATAGHQLNRESRLGWEALSDLEHEAAAASRFTVEQWRALAYAATRGLPVELTWQTRLGDKYEVATAYVVVDHLSFRGRDSTDRMHVQYCGFSHDVYLSQVVDVAVPKMVTTYRDTSAIV